MSETRKGEKEMERKGEKNPLSGAIHGKYTWCLHCEESYLTTAWIEKNWECPGKDCDGNVLDAWDWKEVRRFNPQYPEIPEMGKYYACNG